MGTLQQHMLLRIIARASKAAQRPSLSHHFKVPQRANMATLGAHSKKHKVTIIGSGNWGSTIAKIIAENTKEHPDIFEENVQMWVYEEEVVLSKDSKHYNASRGDTPQKLTKDINTNPSVVDAAKDSSILIFNLPHQFIGRISK